MAMVLLVEDDRDTREMLRLVLEDAGHMVAEAADGLEGLAEIRASTVPLVVLLDLDLPKLGGIEVLQTSAQDSRFVAYHAFIVMTAMSQRQYLAAEEICAKLATPLVTKPFDIDRLLDQVTSAAHRIPSSAPGRS
jgi:two-component system, cell cycle response regulator CpdR